MQKNPLNFDEAAANLIVRMQKSARWRLQATVVKLTYQLQSLYLPSFGIELGQRAGAASYICIKQTQNEIHLEIIISCQNISLLRATFAQTSLRKRTCHLVSFYLRNHNIIYY
jgi:hypothetical protein